MDSLSVGSVKNVQAKALNFKGSEEEQFVTQPPVDEEKSNAAKYMIGATALATVAALGVLGYKGKLGESVQKFLGGAKKAVEEGGAKLKDEAGKAADAVKNKGAEAGEVVAVTYREVSKNIKGLIKAEKGEKFSKALKGILYKIGKLPNEKAKDKAFTKLGETLFEKVPVETLKGMTDADFTALARKALKGFRKAENNPKATLEDCAKVIKKRLQDAIKTRKTTP